VVVDAAYAVLVQLPRIRGRRRRVGVVVALIVVGVSIDLRFSAHPAWSIGLLAAFVVLFVAVRAGMLRRGGEPR
jgi:hypothetical protein